MKILYIVILILLAILWLCAKICRPELPSVENGYSRVFLTPAAQICKWLGGILNRSAGGKRVRRSIRDQRLSASLNLLYPGDLAEDSLNRYRVELVSTIMLILACGAVVCLIVTFKVESEGILSGGNRIYRNTYGGENVEADLSAGIKNNTEDMTEESADEFRVTLDVGSRVYTQAEADALFEEMSGKIAGLVLGDNDAADHILYPVNLVKSVEGYPFTISWECDNYELIDYDGLIHNEDLTEPVIVTLTCDSAYMKEHRYTELHLAVCPPEKTGEELIYEEIMNVITGIEEDTRTEEAVSLPDRISYGDIIWKENLDDMSPLILLGALVVCVLVVPFKESEVNSLLKKRSRDLLIEYPAFVSRLTLYLGAGMSIRNCLIGFGKQAYTKASGRKKLSYLEKELIITAHELEVGISDQEAIEHFGKRCGTREYMRFSALVAQNMRKGSSDLIGMLKEESDDAFELRKNEARKLGEEASTKMLLPMVMMLTVVMIIIMVPAYMSFSS